MPDRRELRLGLDGRAYVDERGHRDRARGRRARRPLQAAARGRRPPSTWRRSRCGSGRDARFVDHSLALGRRARRATTSTCASRARAASARSTASSSSSGKQHHRHPHAHRPRGAALHQPRALQGHPGRPGARRLRRHDRGAPGRAEDRRPADEQEPAALARGARAQHAAARDPRRRREVQARLDHRPARPAALFYLRSRGIGEAAARGAADLRVRERPGLRDDRRPSRCAQRSSAFLQAAARRGRRRGGGLHERAAAARRHRARRRRRSAATSRSCGETVHGKPLVYLDSAASAQKPRAVIDAEREVYEHYYANIHRGVHRSRRRPTDAYEAARGKVQRFLGAASQPRDHLRCAAPPRRSTWWPRATAAATCGAGDEVLITGLEHHSNIVPWQMLCEENGRRAAGRADRRRGRDRPRRASSACSRRARKLVAVAHVSNALGTINPVRRIDRAGPRARARPCWSTARRRAPHLTRRRAGARTATSTRSPATRSTARRAIGVLYGKRERCSRRCRPGRAAAT